MAKKSEPKAMDGSGKKSGSLLEGLTNHSPAGIDSSGMRTGHTINNDATRSGVGGQPTAPGPREA